MAASSKSHHIQSVKQFSMWLARQGTLGSRAPVLLYKALRVREGDQRLHKALPSDEDVARLMDLDVNLPTGERLTAAQRRLTYRIICVTGIGTKELFSRTKNCISSRGIGVEASKTKNRGAAHLLCPAWLLKEVSQYCKTLAKPDSRLFHGAEGIKFAQHVRTDPEAMGGDPHAYGGVLGPHSLRVWFTTKLAKTPTSPSGR